MRRLGPGALLMVLTGVVPLIVIGAGLVALLLLRAGHGLLFGAGVPFAVGILLVVVLSVVLGRAARGGGGNGR